VKIYLGFLVLVLKKHQTMGEGSPAPRLDSQFGPCVEKEREMADMCRLHKPEQGMPKGPQVMDLIARCKLLSFLDAYSSYHQIPLAKVDQPTTTFITPFGCFCYVKMSFGLKNAGATYQRRMQSCFKEQIRRNLVLYVDDIVVKTQQDDSLIVDLEEEETFTNLRRFNIRLNPEKCNFGVPQGKLLGYIISKRGIEANPDKILAIAKIG
jgi:hypothetical protein